ncbi:MAG: TonB-dependent receptor [Candidatus Thioglobus sp.]|jgi:vitamin B12 transporter
MNIKQLSLAAAVSALTFTTATNAVLGPIPIYLNTEYRTANPVIGSIASKVVVTKEEIEQSGARTFLELLASIPSANLEAGQGSTAAIRIRGNDARHTIVLVDGIKVSWYGQPHLELIPFDQIERVEIVKGPYSSLYGSGAIGGVVHVFTNKGAKNGEHNTVNVSYGTHNSRKVSYSSSISEDGNYLNFTVSNYHTDGIDAKDTGSNDKDSIDRRSASFNIGKKFTESTNLSFGILNSKADVNYDDGTNNNDLNQYNFELNHKFFKDLSSKLSYAQNEQSYYGSDYKESDITFTSDFKVDNGILIGGISHQKDEITSGTSENSNTDLFAQWQRIVLGNDTVIGVRNINHDRFGDHFTYNIALARSLDNGWRVSGAYGKATKLASISKTSANIDQSKTDLKPEQSKNVELGIEKKSDWGIVSIKAYKNTVNDFFKYNGPWGSHYYSNDGKYNIKGIDVNLKSNIAGWDVDTEYTYNKSVKDGTNYQTGRRPKNSIGISATKEHGKYTNRIGIIGKSWAWDDNNGTNKLGGYGLLNLATSYQYNNDVKITATINNTLNKEYEVAKDYNQLGRTFNLGITHNF